MAWPLKECEVEKLILYFFLFLDVYKFSAGNSVRRYGFREVRTSNNYCVAVNMVSSSLPSYFYFSVPLLHHLLDKLRCYISTISGFH